MDTFIEQIVKITPTAKVKFLKIAFWTVGILFGIALIAFSVLYLKWAFILLLIAAASFFIPYYLCSQLNHEFEYIITNTDIDIDRIINKRKRQRMASFTCSDIEKIEKYDSLRHNETKTSQYNTYFACTPDEDSYALYIKHPKKRYYILVFSPNEKFKDALRKFLPYNLKKDI